MDRKYWVPALERADEVLQQIAEAPGQLKMSHLLGRLNISKSTLFNLLQTMEQLQWIRRDATDTYRLGTQFGFLGHAFFRQFELGEHFRDYAVPLMKDLEESIQLAVLDGREILYLAKVEAPSPVQMVSGPGAKFPAHATGLGKALLSGVSDGDLDRLYPEEQLVALTPHTIQSKSALRKELREIRESGLAQDREEGVIGFCCAAAPVKDSRGQVVAAVSISMPNHHWETKGGKAQEAVLQLSRQLSRIV